MKEVWHKINSCLFNLSKENWGFPYHILAGLIAFQFFFAVFWKLNIIFMQSSIFSWLMVNFIGLVNEMFQKEERGEFWQDVIGNNIGVVIGFNLLSFLKLIVGF